MGTAEEYRALTQQVADGEFGAGTREGRVFFQMMRQESGHFDPDVVECRRQSSAGAEGIAQIIRRWHPNVEPCDPPAALRYAARWLRDLNAQYGNLRAACAAYNAGPGQVSEWQRQYGLAWELNVFAETAAYLRICMEGALLRVPLGEANGLRMPWQGAIITQIYGWSDFALQGGYNGGIHTGIDVGQVGGVPVGTLCAAVLPGEVLWRGWNGNYGISVIASVDGHPDLTQSYSHLAGPTVFTGNRIEAGSVIGYVGSTGRSTAPHTHMEFRLNNTVVDPAPYISGALPPEPEPPAPPPPPEPEPDRGAGVLRVIAQGLDDLSLRAAVQAQAARDEADRRS